MTLVINLIGEPCSGKSTIASGLFYELKKRNINCELALEFAKDKVYEEAFRTMDDQIYIFAKQYHKLWRLRDKVDVIITDSPLPISLYYMKEDSKYFKDFVIEQYNKFNNQLYFINRSEVYQQDGRIQTKEESEQIDKELITLLLNHKVPFVEVEQKEAIDVILNNVLKTLNDE